MKVHELIAMLQKLPPNAAVWTCGLEGVYPAECGNLFPLKVLETEFGVGLYFDDGLSEHNRVTQFWEPLDEYVNGETDDAS